MFESKNSFAHNYVTHYTKLPSVTWRSVCQENAFHKSKNPLPLYSIGSNNSFILIENNFSFGDVWFQVYHIWIQSNSTLWPMGKMHPVVIPQFVLYNEPWNAHCTATHLSVLRLIHQVNTSWMFGFTLLVFVKYKLFLSFWPISMIINLFFLAHKRIECSKCLCKIFSLSVN